jgi:hypothetical protein
MEHSTDKGQDLQTARLRVSPTIGDGEVAATPCGQRVLPSEKSVEQLIAKARRLQPKITY